MHHDDEPTDPRDRAVAAMLLVGVLAAYAATSARTVLGGDNGEFATLLADGGVAHPPGYPLFTLYLRAMRWLPAASPAHAAALATALLGGACAWALWGACRAWGASRGAATLATALYAASPLAWKLATHAEVFTPSALLAAAIVCAAGPLAGPRGVRRVALLGLLAGLGLANHHTVALVAPIGLLGVARGLRESPRKFAAASLGLGALALGLAPYAALVFAARSAGERWAWGDATTLAGLWHHVSRGDYGTMRLAMSDAPPEVAAQLARLGADLVLDLLAAPALLALLAAGLVVARPARGRSRADGVALVLAFALAGPLFVARFNIAPQGIGAEVIERFYLLPLLLLSLLLALGLDALAAAVRVPRAAALGLGVTLVATQVAMAWPSVREHHRPTVEAYLRDTLDSAPPGAVLLGGGDHRMFGFLYARRALGLRPDVTFVDLRMMLHPFYRERIARELGVALEAPATRSFDSLALATRLLAAGRPVFVTNAVTPAIVRGLPTYPVGTLLRVLAPGAPLPAPLAVEAENAALAERQHLEPTPPADPGSWAGDVRESYARPWAALAQVFARAGDDERAQRAAARVEAIAPWLAP